MLDGGKSTSIVSSILLLLLKVWNEWNVRGMVLLSLSLQIILSILGSCRKYKNNFFTRIFLYFAYPSADWVAIATLSKLPGSYPGSPTSNILRSFWAPFLILHLGGPDTITTYAYEDSKLWTKHLLILVAKVVLVIYIIFSSWTPSPLSFLTFPLIIAGIAKYVERILCLKLINSQKTKPVFSFLNFSHLLLKFNELQPTFQNFLKKNANVFVAYINFSIMRPDVNNYQSYNLSSAKIRIETSLEEILGSERTKASKFAADLKSIDFPVDYILENMTDSFLSLTTELGLIFDFVYTKSALIYSKKGCFLRLTSLACSFLVLILFLINIMNQTKFHFSIVDIHITGILLGGAIALELYAAWVIFSSDWAILAAVFQHNVLVGKMFWFVLKCFPCFLNRRKRWSTRMGQFDLLKYCLRYKKKEANNSCAYLQKKTIRGDLFEMWRKFMCITYVKIPNYLKQDEVFPSDLDSFFHEENTFKAPRGKRALQARQQYDQLKWSIESDFDYCIILWHLATSVCYYHDDSQDREDAMKISKCASDYMMYLLVKRPAMLLPEDGKSFWLDHTYDKLKELFFPATNTKAACELLSELVGDDNEENYQSSESTLDNLLKDVQKLIATLDQLGEKWEMIKEVWVEMLIYGAFSSSNISHVKQLGEGGEFLSLLWLFGGVIMMIKIGGS